MKAVTFIRAAAVTTGVMCVGHLLGSPWTLAHDARGAAVVEAMKSYRFAVMGFERSYFDFYAGFGWSIEAYLLAQAAVLWTLPSVAGSDVARTRPIIGIFCAANFIASVLAWRFLFTAPLVISGIITVCLAAALVLLDPRPVA